MRAHDLISPARYLKRRSNDAWQQEWRLLCQVISVAEEHTGLKVNISSRVIVSALGAPPASFLRERKRRNLDPPAPRESARLNPSICKVKKMVCCQHQLSDSQPWKRSTTNRQVQQEYHAFGNVCRSNFRPGRSQAKPSTLQLTMCT